MKLIPETEYYYACEDGFIYSKHPRYKRSQDNFLRLKGVADKDGYLHVSIYQNNKKTKCKIHRLVAMTYLANPQDLPVINHKNGIKNDNRLENLEWCSIKENLDHLYKELGYVFPNGTKHKKSKLYNWININTKQIEYNHSPTMMHKKYGGGQSNYGRVGAGVYNQNAGWMMLNKYDQNNLPYYRPKCAKLIPICPPK